MTAPRRIGDGPDRRRLSRPPGAPPTNPLVRRYGSILDVPQAALEGYRHALAL